LLRKLPKVLGGGYLHMFMPHPVHGHVRVKKRTVRQRKCHFLSVRTVEQLVTP